MGMLARSLWRLLITIALLGVLAAPAPAAAEVGDTAVTVDFSDVGAGKVFDPGFFRSDGLLFPEEQCGSMCGDWSVGYVQGDDALLQPGVLAPIEGTFTRPVSDVSFRVAPAFQGTATYFLKVYGSGGRLLADTSVTVTEDYGDPENTGFGYFTIGVSDLSEPAKSFVLDNVFVRSSFPTSPVIPYGVSSISYVHWRGGSGA